ncbi:MAG: rhamnulose-1-phosphate aldolase [Oscillospiraceae bacterium]
MYRMGWDERNGGNVSVMLEEDEVAQYIDIENCQRHVEMDFDASALIGKIFIVTGTGKYFRNIITDPANNMGIIRVANDGKSFNILWGHENDGRPTSEISAHFMSHIERLKIDPNHRVIMHAHPVNTVAMTFIHSLDEREFTRTLWQMETECMVVFADGVSVLPWMLCGNPEIGRATAEKMKEFRLVVWAAHGIFGTGKDIDEAFGLIETVEKAADIYMHVANFPILQSITDKQLQVIADAFHVVPRAGFLDV